MRVQQAVAVTWTAAQRQALIRRMPGATPLTCDITLLILAQRGLLDGMPRPKRRMRYSPRGHDHVTGVVVRRPDIP
jgi:hypothetical protein